jgi:HAD superfamily hydrolase (TIGR01450 family)
MSVSKLGDSRAIMARLAKIRCVVLDLDGTLYLDSQLFDCSLPFLREISEIGIDYVFVTNNSSSSSKEYQSKLHKLGITAKLSQIHISTHATIAYLRAEYPAIKRIFILGNSSLQEEFSNSGFSVCPANPRIPVDAVVVGFDTSLIYQNLCHAAYLINQGKPYFATHPDLVCPTAAATVLVDCGAIIECLKAATGRRPDAILGKPEPWMLLSIMRKEGFNADEIMMVGDRVYTDIVMAQRANVMAVLVLSGETKLEQAKSVTPQPDIILHHIGELGKILIRAKSLSY